MGNLGKVKVWAQVGGKMPNMDFSKVDSVFDLPASDAYQSFQSRQQGDPSEIEFIENPTAGGFFVIPQRYPCQIANYVNGITSSADLASPRVVWDVLPSEGGLDGVKSSVGGESYLTSLITNTDQKTLIPNSESYGSNLYPAWYTGPRWSIPRGPVSKVPADNTETEKEKQAKKEITIINKFHSDKKTTTTADASSTAIIAQESVCPDIWWSIQTTSLSKNTRGTPFYIDVVLQKPLAVKQPTFFLLRIGNLGKDNLNENKNIIDLLFIDGRPGILYDRGAMANVKNANGEEEITPANITLNGGLSWNGSPQRISVVPLAGRLCINVNGSDTLYTRSATDQTTKKEGDKKGTSETSDSKTTSKSLTKGSLPFIIPFNMIRAVGSNSKAIVSLGSIIFPRQAKLPTSMPGGFNPDTSSSTGELKGSKSGVADETECSMVELPGGGNGGIILGACAKTCNGATLNANDSWGSILSSDMHGEIYLFLEKDKKGASSDGRPPGQHYVIGLLSDYAEFGESNKDADSSSRPRLCPIWFRMRGATRIGIAPNITFKAAKLDDDIMEVSESFASSDRYHITHSLDIILYNENGKYDYLAEKSAPIQVGFSWNVDNERGNESIEDVAAGNNQDEDRTTIFTGVILNGVKALVPGKETLSLHCEDYMFILEATQVINSPYYDGMDAYNVVRDLARKAHIMCTDDSGSEAGQRYFLASGYSFLEPVKHYDGKSSLKECMLDVCSSGSKVIYFDGDGLLHFDNIQGGIGFTDTSKVKIVGAYESDPDIADDKHLILDETRTEMKLNSVVNNMLVLTIDRTDRTKIIQNDKASTTEDILGYRKVFFAQVPSLGSYEALVEYIERNKMRLYKPVMSVTIKTADDTPFIPMSFMTVNGYKYRIMGLNRSIRIEDNSITNTITGEWFGKQ